MAKKLKVVVKLQRQCGQGQSGSAHRPGAGAARHQPDGVLQGIQCAHGQHGRAR